MSALKVSLDFLEGPVPKIITKCSHIAKSMSGNEHFPLSPISSGGLQSCVNELNLLQKKTTNKKNRHTEERDIALADVNDYIQQIAPYIEHACKNNLEVLLSSGFDQKVNGEQLKTDQLSTHFLP